MEFIDRKEAGKVLSSLFQEHIGDNDVLLLAIPNGGIPVGIEIKNRLNINVTFSLLFIRKLQIPYNPEAGFGAITLTGKVFLNEKLVNHLYLSKEDIESSRKFALKTLETRATKYGFKDLDISKLVQHRTTILVDDGLASGFTMLAAIKSIEQEAPNIIVAVPTASERSVQLIKSNTNARIICPDIRGGHSFAVANAYENWRDIPDSEAIEMIQSLDG